MAARPPRDPVRHSPFESLGTADELIALVRRQSSDLSEGQRKVVEFFVTHCDRAVFLTSLEVARETGVSEATVVRTARALGFGGYPEFRTAFRSYFVERMSTVTRVRLTAAPRRSVLDIIDTVMESDRKNLEATRTRADEKSLGRAADMIGSARMTYIIALRSGYGLAWLLYFSLRLIRVPSRIVTLGASDVTEQLEAVGKGDVVFGMTFERYTRATVELFTTCVEKGARGIALTDKLTSPLAAPAEVVLESPTRLSSFIDSFVGPTAVINVLLTLIAAKRRRKVLRILEQREQDWRKSRTYL
jgi:DNA-binding MurR/RpiR family transcriptional regulator